MRKHKLSLIVYAFLLTLFGSCFSKQSNDQKITIAAAASMQFVLKEIVHEFSTSSGVDCDLILGSSGKLTAQIIEGAPYDVFLSADEKYANELSKKGLMKSPVQIFSKGKLVLWSMTNHLDKNIHLLKNQTFRHIAVANPKTAPYGVATIDCLKYYGLLQSIENKLVFGESIAQVNQFISSKSADVGFTALSVVLSPKLKNKGNWIELDNESYSPINQSVVLIENEKSNSKEIEQFHQFLFSKKSKNILKEFGYIVNE